MAVDFGDAMKRRVRILRWGGLIAPVVALTLAGCGQVQEAAVVSEPAPVPVEVIPIDYQDYVESVAVTGSLVSRARVEVKAETTGRIVSFPKEQGDRVEQGEVLASVDEENYQIAIRQAETSVRVTEATLARTRVVEAHAEAELERARNLVNSGGITDQDLKSAEVAAQEGAAQVALAEAQLDQAQANLEQAQKRLRDTAIRAPVGGVIETKHINTGAYVEMSTPVVTIVDNTKLEMLAPIPSAQLGRVAAGQTVRFGVDSYPDVVFEGRLIEISPAVDAQIRAIAVRIQVPNTDGRLKAGMFAKGEIVTGVQEQAIVIPASAIYRAGGAGEGSYVFVVDNNVASRRELRIAEETDSMVLVAEGLGPGDRLIAEQSIELADGVRVRPEG